MGEFDRRFRDQPPRSDRHHDLLNNRVSDGSQTVPHPTRMEGPMLLVNLTKIAKKAKSELKLSFLCQVVDSVEPVSEGDSLHAMGVRKRETRLREVRRRTPSFYTPTDHWLSLRPGASTTSEPQPST